MTYTDMPKVSNLPTGKYTYVTFDIDATGRRILDEIVHLAAYTPDDQFNQYVIPVMNFNPAAKHRHRLCIITIGFFRTLKCTLTNKVVKCETEIVALKSFLNWLEQRKAADPGSNGIVLVHHESIKFTPFMLLKSLQKYELMERFSKTVAGFVDGHALTEAKCESTAEVDLLRDMVKPAKQCDANDSQMEDAFVGNAAVRAETAYKIIQHLAKADKPETDENIEITWEFIKEYAQTVKSDVEELTNQDKCIDLQHTYRPVFVDFFKTNLRNRYKAVTFRRVLAENGYDLNKLEAIWNDKKKEGITEVITKLENLKDEYRDELTYILDAYFDPEKEPMVPAANKIGRRRRSSGKTSGKENRSPRKNGKHKKKHSPETNNNEASSSPDSGTRSPGHRRRSRRSQLRLEKEQAKKDLGAKEDSPLNLPISATTIEAK